MNVDSMIININFYAQKMAIALSSIYVCPDRSEGERRAFKKL